VSAHRRVVVEADGGSRGNPGPAAYGAVLRDADTGEVIAEEGTTLGVATNNVAEYSGLVAGLRLAVEHAPGAQVEVRMDSKLVVEQMSGRWKIKHPDMKPLALEANRVAPPGTTYTWVPRERNKHADRLANEALDGVRSGVTLAADKGEESLLAEVESPGAESPGAESPGAEPPGVRSPEVEREQPPARGWSAGATATTLVLVRHGVTAHTAAKRFSGGLGGTNPPLSDEGRAQVRATAEWLRPLGHGEGSARASAVVASPVRRTRETADILAAELGLPVVEEPGFAEMEFGAWEGLTFAEVQERDPDGLAAWLGRVDVTPPGGESFRSVRRRVQVGLGKVLAAHRGGTVVVASHVTPIKVLVAEALGAPVESVFRMELSPASVTVVSFYDDDRASLRLYNAAPTGEFTAR